MKLARALLVEDDALIRTCFSSILEREGFDVVAVSCSGEGVRTLSGQHFDLVVTDMRMETPTAGYEVVRAARALSSTTKILILTAFPLQKDDWKRAGADAVIQKAASISHLLSVVREIAASVPNDASISTPTSTPPESKSKG
jgi:CheY-like chemotaxis protein